MEEGLLSVIYSLLEAGHPMQCNLKQLESEGEAGFPSSNLKQANPKISIKYRNCM